MTPAACKSAGCVGINLKLAGNSLPVFGRSTVDPSSEGLSRDRLSIISSVLSLFSEAGGLPNAAASPATNAHPISYDSHCGNSRPSIIASQHLSLFIGHFHLIVCPRASSTGTKNEPHEETSLWSKGQSILSQSKIPPSLFSQDAIYANRRTSHQYHWHHQRRLTFPSVSTFIRAHVD